jgi:hypothetical protein
VVTAVSSDAVESGVTKGFCEGNNFTFSSLDACDRTCSRNSSSPTPLLKTAERKLVLPEEEEEAEGDAMIGFCVSDGLETDISLQAMDDFDESVINNNSTKTPVIPSSMSKENYETTSFSTNAPGLTTSNANQVTALHSSGEISGINFEWRIRKVKKDVEQRDQFMTHRKLPLDVTQLF